MIADFGLRISDCPDGQIWNLQSGIQHLLCICQTSPQVPTNNDWLSREEQNVSARFHVPKRKADWRLGRWTAKRAICAFQSLQDTVLPSLEIRAAGDGAPEAFLNGKPAAVSISISHSRDRGLCLVGPVGMAVGCDLESIEPREENFAADYFTLEELSLVQQAPAGRELAETLIWSAKETALKVIRKGLSRDTRSICIRADFSGDANSWKSWTGECLESSRLFKGLWRAADGFVYTLASDQLPRQQNRS